MGSGVKSKSNQLAAIRRKSVSSELTLVLSIESLGDLIPNIDIIVIPSCHKIASDSHSSKLFRFSSNQISYLCFAEIVYLNKYFIFCAIRLLLNVVHYLPINGKGRIDHQSLSIFSKILFSITYIVI